MATSSETPLDSLPITSIDGVTKETSNTDSPDNSAE
jgi:hypothetical protein